MTRISDALTYGLTIRESATDGSDFTNPATDYRRLFLGEDGQLHAKDSAGTVTALGGTETLPVSIIAAKGDLIVGTANDTAAVLTAGTNDYVLTAASGEATGLKWAAAAGGGVEPWLVDIHVFQSHGNTNWSTITNVTVIIYYFDIESNGTQNATIYWYVGLSGGTWDIGLMHNTGTNRGIYSVQVDDTEVGTVDGYAGVAAKNVISAVTGVAISAGKRKIALKMATKNASSSSYYGAITHLQLRRTA
jgi:hypothetical protein